MPDSRMILPGDIATAGIKAHQAGVGTAAALLQQKRAVERDALNRLYKTETLNIEKQKFTQAQQAAILKQKGQLMDRYTDRLAHPEGLSDGTILQYENAYRKTHNELSVGWGGPQLPMATKEDVAGGKMKGFYKDVQKLRKQKLPPQEFVNEVYELMEQHGVGETTAEFGELSKSTGVLGQAISQVPQTEKIQEEAEAKRLGGQVSIPRIQEEAEARAAGMAAGTPIKKDANTALRAAELEQRVAEFNYKQQKFLAAKKKEGKTKGLTPLFVFKLADDLRNEFSTGEGEFDQPGAIAAFLDVFKSFKNADKDLFKGIAAAVLGFKGMGFEDSLISTEQDQVTPETPEQIRADYIAEGKTPEASKRAKARLKAIGY